MSTQEMLDVEGVIRDRLKASAAVTAIAGNRAFFGIPKQATEATFPLLTVQRVGGGDDLLTDAPIEYPLLQIDAWASLKGSKAEAFRLVNTLRSLLRSMSDVTVISMIWLPDPDNDRARYSLTVEVTAIGTDA